MKFLFVFILLFDFVACKNLFKHKVKVNDHKYNQGQLYGFYTPCAEVGKFKKPGQNLALAESEDSSWVKISNLPRGITSKITLSKADSDMAFVSFFVEGKDGNIYELFNGVQYGGRELLRSLQDGMLKVNKGRRIGKIEFSVDPSKNNLLEKSSWNEKYFGYALQKAMSISLQAGEASILLEINDDDKKEINLDIYQRINFAYWDGAIIRPATEEYFVYNGNHYKALVNWDGVGNFAISNLVMLGGSVVDGKAKVKLNNNDATETNITLSNMEGNGYLCSNSLVSATEKDSPRAFSQDNIFSYNANAQEYGEMVGFSHVSSMYNWYVSKLGPNWSGSQILIYFTDDASRIANGPQYQNPAFTSGAALPIILAPDKMGNVSEKKYSLANLRTDSDALTHEVGHHFMYQFVGLASPEEHKAVLEAYPDTFVMLRFKDPCMCETICLKGNTVCMKTSCLRYADNNYTYKSNDFAALSFHKKSVMVSGLYWDLNTKTNLGNDYVIKLALKAMSFLQPTTDFRDVVAATFEADKVLADGKNFCAIWKQVKARKLDFAQDFNCQDKNAVFN